MTDLNGFKAPAGWRPPPDLDATIARLVQAEKRRRDRRNAQGRAGGRVYLPTECSDPQGIFTFHREKGRTGGEYTGAYTGGG